MSKYIYMVKRTSYRGIKKLIEKLLYYCCRKNLIIFHDKNILTSEYTKNQVFEFIQLYIELYFSAQNYSLK